jgi:hypothetical protein
MFLAVDVHADPVDEGVRVELLEGVLLGSPRRFG